MTTRKPAAVSMDPELYEKAKARAKSLGFATWSAYVVQLIRNDIASGGGMSIVEESPRKSAECVPLPAAAVSPITPPLPSPTPPETANVVRLSPQHLVYSKRKRGRWRRSAS